MLSAAIKGQYSSELPLLCLPVFNEICGTVINFVFCFRSGNTMPNNRPNEIANTPLERSTIVLIVSNDLPVFSS